MVCEDDRILFEVRIVLENLDYVMNVVVILLLWL